MFFGLQLTFPSPRLDALAAIVGARQPVETAVAKRAQHHAMFSELRGLLPSADRGTWTCVPEGAESFDLWCSIGAERPVGEAVGHVLIAIHAVEPSRAAGNLRALASVAPDEIARRSTFDRFLRELHKLDWLAVRGDAVFVRGALPSAQRAALGVLQ